MTNRKITIARLFDRYSGSADYYLFDQIRMIDKDKFRNVIIYLERDSTAPEPMEKEGFKSYILSNSRKIKLFSFTALFRLFSVLKKEKIDILHCNRHQATMYGAVAARLAGVKIVISHVHGLNRNRNLRRALNYRMLGSSIKCFLACSNNVRKDIITNFHYVKPEQVVELENSIDVPVFRDAVADREAIRVKYSLSTDAFVFIAVGRLSETKDYSTLIKAFGLVLEKHPDIQLIIFGDGRLRGTLESEIKVAGLAGKVLLPGRVLNVPAMLKSSNCYVMSSIAEGMPLALMEAMAAGVPVISTNVGGIPEVVLDERYGLLVESENAEQMADAMTRVLEMSGQQRQAMVKNAQDRVVSVYNHKVIVAKLEKIYMDLIETNG